MAQTATTASTFTANKMVAPALTIGRFWAWRSELYAQIGTVISYPITKNETTKLPRDEMNANRAPRINGAASWGSTIRMITPS